MLLLQVSGPLMVGGFSIGFVDKAMGPETPKTILNKSIANNLKPPRIIIDSNCSQNIFFAFELDTLIT